MKKFTFLIVLVIVASFSLVGKNSADETNQIAEGSIIDFEDMEQVMLLAEDKPTVLFFKANWCPSCRSAAKKFSEGEAELEDVYLVVVNYDNSKELQVKYGVTYQHTFVQVDSKGEALATWSGGAVDELLENIVKGDM